MCSCGYPLFVKYDLKRLKNEIKKSVFKERPGTLWRYQEFLPVIHSNHIISLGEGYTPILKMDSIGKSLGLEKVYLKNEGQNPTGTFKDRGASVGVSKALELNIPAAILNSTGNAAAAWSAYSSKSGLDLYVLMPHDVQESCLIQCGLNKAHILLFKIALHKLGNVADQLSRKLGIFNANSFKEPYRLEGKKTMGLEIAEMFHWELPEVIIYPTGTGTGIVGIWKAFSELAEIGWISHKTPRLVVVQLEGCAPYVRAFVENKDQCDVWENVQNVPGGIRSPKPQCDFMVLDILRKTEGIALAVNLKETISIQHEVAEKEGLYVCPEGATTFAALKKLKASGWIKNEESILLMNTGNGLKYIPMIEKPKVPILENEEDIPDKW
jgi:threonine synthase